MEFIFGFILEMFGEGVMEASVNKKVSRWIRYPLLIVIILFFGFIFVGLLALSVTLWKENIFVSIFFIIIAMMFPYSFYKQIKKVKNKRKDLDEE